MDVLKPQLIWVGKRCYRINNSDFGQGKKELQGNSSSGGYEEDNLYNDEDDEEFEIFEHNKNLKTEFHVPHLFYSQVIGTKGLTKKRIEAETKTQINIPRQGVEGDVTITGQTRQSIISAGRKINLIVLAARNRHQFTHFVSIPLNNNQIKTAYEIFKTNILDSCYPTINSSLFQNPNKLHLTICTLTLMDNQDRAFAAEILNEIINLIQPIFQQNSQNIELKVEGLEIMNDDSSAVDVLYGVVKSNALQHIADIIFDKFVSKGLAPKKLEHIKLHCTLLNSLFNEEEHQQRQTFDARQILQNYSNYHFGTLKLTEIHLSQRYSTSCDGFYEATGIIKL